jgi:hypothetical protein
MLGVPQSDWFAGSFESGQMVVDKKRHWRGLATAAWLNTYARFWCVDRHCVWASVADVRCTTVGAMYTTVVAFQPTQGRILPHPA